MSPEERFLDEMRLIGDPVVDPIVADHLAPGDAGRLLRDLFRTSGMPEDHPLVAAYLRGLPEVDLVDQDKVEQGQRLFEQWGPEILLTLGSYALPVAYASGHGAQAVYRARRLKEEPVRRLCDTAQMVVNSMQAGGLCRGGIGWTSTRKVRLVHALIRHQILDAPQAPWSMEWGLPINQEDQAGTLLSFSIGAIDGLRKMGAAVSREDADAYVFAWSAIGRLLGVADALLPAGEEQAVDLALRIGRRQLRPTPEGQELMEQLLAAVDTLFPFRGYALSLSHFFLRDTVFGPDVAAMLKLPPPNWTKSLVAIRAAHERAVFRLLDVIPGARARRRAMARYFIQALILLKRPDGPAPFAVPEGLSLRWTLAKKA